MLNKMVENSPTQSDNLSPISQEIKINDCNNKENDIKDNNIIADNIIDDNKLSDSTASSSTSKQKKRWRLSRNGKCKNIKVKDDSTPKSWSTLSSSDQESGKKEQNGQKSPRNTKSPNIRRNQRYQKNRKNRNELNNQTNQADQDDQIEQDFEKKQDNNIEVKSPKSVRAKGFRFNGKRRKQVKNKITKLFGNNYLTLYKANHSNDKFNKCFASLQDFFVSIQEWWRSFYKDHPYLGVLLFLLAVFNILPLMSFIGLSFGVLASTIIACAASLFIYLHTAGSTFIAIISAASFFAFVVWCIYMIITLSVKSSSKAYAMAGDFAALSLSVLPPSRPKRSKKLCSFYEKKDSSVLANSLNDNQKLNDKNEDEDQVNFSNHQNKINEFGKGNNNNDLNINTNTTSQNSIEALNLNHNILKSDYKISTPDKNKLSNEEYMELLENSNISINENDINSPAPANEKGFLNLRKMLRNNESSIIKKNPVINHDSTANSQKANFSNNYNKRLDTVKLTERLREARKKRELRKLRTATDQILRMEREKYVEELKIVALPTMSPLDLSVDGISSSSQKNGMRTKEPSQLYSSINFKKKSEGELDARTLTDDYTLEDESLCANGFALFSEKLMSSKDGVEGTDEKINPLEN